MPRSPSDTVADAAMRSLCFFGAIAGIDPEGCVIVDQRGSQDEWQKPPVPAAVEKVTGNKQQQVLPTMGQKPINPPNDGEKDPKCVAVKKHTRGLVGIIR